MQAAHPEITGLELAASRSEQEGCKTIAATEVKEIGEKCDEDEFAAMKTDQPFVEKEKDEFDATLPIHDAAGKIIGTVGMDLRPARARRRKPSPTRPSRLFPSWKSGLRRRSSCSSRPSKGDVRPFGRALMKGELGYYSYARERAVMDQLAVCYRSLWSRLG
jgi:hypothetical protein